MPIETTDYVLHGPNPRCHDKARDSRRDPGVLPWRRSAISCARSRRCGVKIGDWRKKALTEITHEQGVSVIVGYSHTLLTYLDEKYNQRGMINKIAIDNKLGQLNVCRNILFLSKWSDALGPYAETVFVCHRSSNWIKIENYRYTSAI